MICRLLDLDVATFPLMSSSSKKKNSFSETKRKLFQRPTHSSLSLRSSLNSLQRRINIETLTLIIS